MLVKSESLAIVVSIDAEAHARAKEFCYAHKNEKRAKQVYLNTLAVCATNHYVQCLGFPTDLHSSDSWNPIAQVLLDTADLQVENCGKLECRFVLPGEETCPIPPEVFHERLAYVVVRLDSRLQEATLLGFAKEVSTSELSLDRLEPLEDLLPYLEKHLHEPVRLEQWLQGVWTEGWEALELLLETVHPPELETAFRHGASYTIRQGQCFELERQKMILFIAIAPEENLSFGIDIGVVPFCEHVFLPERLQVRLFDDREEKLAEVTTRENQSCVQLSLSARSGDSFQIAIALGNDRLVQEFIV